MSNHSWSNFREPAAFYQLTCNDNDQNVSIPWANREVEIYVRDKDARVNFNSASGSSTYFLAAGQKYNFTLPWDQTNLANTKLHARNNASGQESVLMIIAYKNNDRNY